MIKAGVYYATYGHWTLSLLNAGYNVKWQVQPDITNPSNYDRYASLLLQVNFPKIDYGVKGEVDIICGSPPCIGFSNANPKSGPDHWANKNFIECFKRISELDPDYFLVEMVQPIFTKGEATLSKALDYVEEYTITYKIFEVSEYGFPCIRKRVYFFGDKYNGNRVPLDLLPKRGPVGCSEVLEPLREKWDNYKPDNIKLMSRYRKDGKLRAGPFSILQKSNRKLKPDKPTFTITGAACSGIIHYSEKDRFLALEEVATLMGFPPGYKFNLKRKSIAQVCQIIASGIDIRFTTYLLKFLKENKYVG